MAEIPVIIKAVDQVSAPAQKMAQNAVASLNTIKPAGVASFNAVTDSAKATSSSIAATATTAQSASKAVVSANTSAAASANATRSAFSGMSVAFRAAFGISAVLMARRAIIEVGKFAIEFSGASKEVEKLHKNTVTLRDIIGKNIFGPTTEGGKAVVAVFERINSTMETAIRLTKEYPKLMELSSNATKYFIERSTQGITLAEKMLALTEKIAALNNTIMNPGGMGGGMRLARGQFQSKIFTGDGTQKHFRNDRPFGGMLPADDMAAINQANLQQTQAAMQGLQQVYSAARQAIMPTINEMTMASQRMWGALSGQSAVPESGTPGLWSGPGSDAMNGIDKKTQTTGGGGGAIGVAMHMNFSMMAEAMKMFSGEIIVATSAVGDAFYSMGEAVGHAMFSSIEAVVAGQQSAKQALRGIAAEAIRAAVAPAKVKAAVELAEAFSWLARGNPFSFAMHMKSAAQWGIVAGLGSAAAGFATGGGGGGGGGGGYSRYSGGSRSGATGGGAINPRYGPAQQPRGTTVQIQIMGNVIGQREYIDRLADQIAKRVGDGARIGVVA